MALKSCIMRQKSTGKAVQNAKNPPGRAGFRASSETKWVELERCLFPLDTTPTLNRPHDGFGKVGESGCLDIDGGEIEGRVVGELDEVIRCRITIAVHANVSVGAIRINRCAHNTVQSCVYHRR